MLELLIEKYGKGFTWFEPSNKLAFENQLCKELIPEHPLYGKKLYVVAKSERNDDVLFSDLYDYYLIHLTWAMGTKDYPHYQRIKAESILSYLEEDYLSGINSEED